MSGDVQPRKRKDKKKRKDELGVEEPRGTAAALGEGDVFIHSYHEHGTGGHWCAKIIFFSLLAVLVTLIGLIILENRGLTELEANAVESRYSGVLEGWIEDTPDDHHDEHTLELTNPDHDDGEVHDDDIGDHEEDDEHENGHDEDSEAEDEDDDQDDEEGEIDDHTETIQESDEDNKVDADNNQSDEEADEDNTEYNLYQKFGDQHVEGDLNEDDDDIEGVENRNYYYKQNKDQVDSEEQLNQNRDSNDKIEESDEINAADDDEWLNEEDGPEDDVDEDDGEVEKIEKEISDEDILSAEASTREEIEDIAEDDGDSEEKEKNNIEENSIEDDDDEPPVEQITVPSTGNPYTEVEEETIQKTQDTLAEEEEYEQQQEELKKEREAQSSESMWLKLVVGGALLVATHAVVRRASAPRDEPDTEEQVNVEGPSVIDRRMTLIPEAQATPQIPNTKVVSNEDIIQKITPVIETTTTPQPVTKDTTKSENTAKKVIEVYVKDDDNESELFSEEEEEDIDEEEVVKEVPKKPEVKETKIMPVILPSTEDPHEDDEDVEIIDEEEIEEELEDEEDEVEEEISDVDDTELLSRLEAKYGRLPEPERPGIYKGGGNAFEENWPGEPSDPYWSQQLDLAEEDLRQGAWSSCERRASAAELGSCARAQWLVARCLDFMAEAKRDNKILSRAIAVYLQLLKQNERLPDQKLVDVAHRAIDRIQFRGTYLNAEPIYRLLIRRFPDNVHYRNNLTVSFLMANRADLAASVLKETLLRWPDDRIALGHYGYVLKNQYNLLTEAVTYLEKALEDDVGAANEPRFYYHLGDALLQLGKFGEAHEVHKRGAAQGHFLSPEQRSLYNVPRLKSRPWWPIETTPYIKLARALETSWREILKEGLAAKEFYEKEKEGLKERGEWSQLDIIVRGKEVPGRCKRAPVTCSIVKSEAAAAGCRRGQVKFSAIEPGTHVRPHVGPTNCRLRMHLGLSNTKDTFIRVGQETRQWEIGKVFIFDDSFEHEVWHNGTGSRLVLIVDVWHPDLTPTERRTLPAI
ncbi:unnamed protein product [Leptosia nina]|uniref:Aspartyl/asparaginy/proline hydroxylase domain-containing protein n=1 Tax=Leptosia nina TaxID=320188 RepID=A0AAV1J8R2_9NEOP